MAFAVAFISMLAAIVPVLIEVWRAKRNQQTKATNAISTRDRDELRAGMDRVDGVLPVADPPARLPP